MPGRGSGMIADLFVALDFAFFDLTSAMTIVFESCCFLDMLDFLDVELCTAFDLSILGPFSISLILALEVYP